MQPRRTEKGGFGYRRVTVLILDFDAGLGICRDTLSQEFEVTLRVRNGRGGWPQVGEEWFITKEFLGRWYFHSAITPAAPPVISTPREGMDRGTEEIFDALITLGLVREEGSDFVRQED